MAALKISEADFRESISPLIGLPISRPWLGYGSALFLELGDLSPPNHGGQVSEKGDYAIFINWDWRVESTSQVLFGSSNDRKEINAGLAGLKDSKIISLEINGPIAEISLNLSNGSTLKSMVMHSGNPQWNIRVGDKTWIWWTKGVFYSGAGEDDSEATAKRWNLPGPHKGGDNCGSCGFYNGIEGNGPVLDHGVCTARLSEYDGRVVNRHFLCPAFLSYRRNQ